jgi:hypothetical protein
MSSPSIFTGLFGNDLNDLIGKKVEVIGYVESLRSAAAPAAASAWSTRPAYACCPEACASRRS